ncbi:hypothetical protein LPY66_02130 [Dehalobacter sp. DCM]|uniref:hypothetical protein n=1 Tax=Dehalobacter sp. DCM TaxID=2907827 RepID=UPI003081758D|nr:hypothetical protein LPY66_02130 [Dehalobacter sp. DCM]
MVMNCVVGSNPTLSAIITENKSGFEREEKENAPYGSVFPSWRDSEPNGERSESHSPAIITENMSGIQASFEGFLFFFGRFFVFFIYGFML